VKKRKIIFFIFSVNSLVAYDIIFLSGWNYCVLPINYCEGTLHFSGSQLFKKEFVLVFSWFCWLAFGLFEKTKILTFLSQEPVYGVLDKFTILVYWLQNAKKSCTYFELKCWWNNLSTYLGYSTSWFGSFVSMHLELCIFLCWAHLVLEGFLI